MFAMAGASANHNLIVGNCVQTLGQQLKKKPCLVYPSDSKLRIEATGLYTYPDLSIVFGETQLESNGGDVLLNPVVLVEVLSDSTEAYDRGLRSREKVRALSIHSQFEALCFDRSRSMLDRLLFASARWQLEFNQLPIARRRNRAQRNTLQA
jgi:Uma2 family endonuclease